MANDKPIINKQLTTKKMKLTLPRKQFLSALKVSAQGVQAKNLLPIMECLKFDLSANSDILTITGGNEEMYIVNTCQMAEPSTSDYSMCINAKDIVDAVSSIDDDEITLSTNDEEGVVEIQYKRGKLSYPFFSSDEYSVMPVGESDSKVSISEEVLAHLINKTIKFIGNSSLYPQTHGVYFNVGGYADGIVECASTNAKSMACKVSVSDIDTSGCLDRSVFILPLKTCQSVIKILPSNPAADKMVDISFSEKNITVSISGAATTGIVSIFSRSIEGIFPNYNGVIPKNNPIVIEMPKQDFVSAIDRVGKSLSKEYSVIEMKLSLSGIIPMVTFIADDRCTKTSGTESLDCVLCEGSSQKDMSIGLNKDYIKMVVSNISTSNVRMSFSAFNRPLRIDGYDGDEGIAIALMPYVTAGIQ